MKISITGYTGFLGGKIVDHLNSSERRYSINKINLRNIGPLNYDNIKKVVVGNLESDVILNCASSLHPKKPSDFFLNEKVPSIIEDIIKEKKSKTTFIHFSTINTIIKKRKDKYSISKRKGEENLDKKISIIVRLPFLLERENNVIRNSGNVKKIYNYLDKKFFPFYPMIYPGHIYQPIELDKLTAYLENLFLNKNKTGELLNIVGKNKQNLWEIFEEIAKIKNKSKILKKFAAQLPQRNALQEI